MAIKSYRGQLKDGGQEQIRLRTNTGKIGYRITKFQIINRGPPGSLNVEAVVKIYKEKQTTVDGIINFSDLPLIAVAYYTESSSPGVKGPATILFDQEVFNQDIFVTYKDSDTSEDFCNYYIELEQVKLSDNESTMATLQSIRSRYESYTPAGPT